MKKLFLFMLFFGTILFTYGQTAIARPSKLKHVQGHKSKQEEMEFLRAKIIAFADNVSDVTCFEDVGRIRLILADDGSDLQIIFASLDADGMSWELSGKELVLKIAAKSGKYAEWHHFQQKVAQDGTESEKAYHTTREFTTISFNTSKIGGEPDFQKEIIDAFKTLIKMYETSR